MSAAFQVRVMQAADHAALMQLLQGVPGVVLRDADGFEATARYLARNPGLSFVAEAAGEGGAQLVGCLMAGHDGRRGYLQHLFVHPAERGRGIARALIAACLAALRGEGIAKTHLDVLAGNADAQAFWRHLGWARRDDIQRFSFIDGAGANA